MSVSNILRKKPHWAVRTIGLLTMVWGTRVLGDSVSLDQTGTMVIQSTWRMPTFLCGGRHFHRATNPEW
jgi:hypothetical protein